MHSQGQGNWEVLRFGLTKAFCGARAPGEIVSVDRVLVGVVVVELAAADALGVVP